VEQKKRLSWQTKDEQMIGGMAGMSVNWRGGGSSYIADGLDHWTFHQRAARWHCVAFDILG
jgi:hypothetical protein